MMKKILLSLIFSIITLAIYAGDLVDYHFTISEYRWAEFHNDFNVTKANGKGFISIDEDGSGYICVEWKGQNKSFPFSSNDLIDVEDDSNSVRLTYRYGSGKVNVELGRYGAIIHYSYGDKFKIWKEK